MTTPAMEARAKANGPSVKVAALFAAYCVWHDLIVHPICGLLWATRMWAPKVGHAADRLHMWSTGWPFK